MKDKRTVALEDLAEAVLSNDPVPCVSEPDIFFPEDLTPLKRNEATESAKQLCSSCPVLDLCRDYAIMTKESYGIWGGTTPAERSQILRKKPTVS